MAKSKLIFTVMKALSQPDLKMKQNYKIIRKVITLSHFHYRIPSSSRKTYFLKTPSHTIPVRIFFPNTKEQSHILLFFHGGGWVTGNINSYDGCCSEMAKITNHIVVSVDYRLAPEYPFPAGLNDCYEVAKKLIEDPAYFELPHGTITFIGDSAGANLAAALSLYARDYHLPNFPKYQILIYPCTYYDHTSSSPYPSVTTNGKDYLLTANRLCDYIDLYKSCDDDLKNPYFAPLNAEDFHNQPTTLLITAELDPLRDEGEDYGKKLKKAGNSVTLYRAKNCCHGFFTLPSLLPAVKETYQKINAFLKENQI